MTSTQQRAFTGMVVDDHPMIRNSLATTLTRLGATRVVEAASIREARRLAVEPLDVCLLDLHLPDGPGLGLLADLAARGWPRLVVVSVSDDPQAVRAAFAAGAHGYLLKSSTLDVIAAGVGAVLDGQVYADPTVAVLLAQGVRSGPVADILEVSPDERELLRLIAAGRTNREIAEAMQLTPLAVKTRLARIGRRLGTGDRSEMVALAMRLGLVR